MTLIIAAHGTRDADGEQDAHRFVARVAAALPGVDVRVGFVELSHPPMDEVMREVATSHDRSPVVVLPLMLASGGHAKKDVPGAIAEGAAANPAVEWRYADVLGPDQRLVDGLVSRIDAANDGRPAEATTVLLVGRGSSDVDSTANVATTARRVMHAGGYEGVETAFIAVARPGIEAGLDRVARLVDPGTPVVVAPYLLFRGLMVEDVRGRVQAWRDAHPGALTNLHVADVLGEDDALVELAVQRYREACERPALPFAQVHGRGDGDRAAAVGAARDGHAGDEGAGGGNAGDGGRSGGIAAGERREVVGTRNADAVFVPYLAGLRLTGRRVVVVGAGRVAARKIAGLLTSQALVTVVAPEGSDAVRDLAERGEVVWERRSFRPSDLNEAWYAIACAGEQAVNEAVGAAAEERRIFCVRADDGDQATAWTPALGHHGHVSVAVLSDRRPHRSQDVRDQIVAALAAGSISEGPADDRARGQQEGDRA